jgi:2-polyprenyl-6-methoxyphenol hydroxylase-like FAD-dependent oxidoreductase
MGLEPLVKQANTTEVGLAFVDSNGRHKASFPASANGPTAELEILRGDLAEILYNATKDTSTWMFGDCIAAVEEEHSEGGAALVKFKSGREERYDFVIVADGVGSRTRKMIFGDEPVRKPIGLRECLLSTKWFS